MSHLKKEQQDILESTEIFISNLKLLLLQETGKFDESKWTDLKLKTGIAKYRLTNFLKDPKIGMNFDTIIRLLNYLDYKFHY
jgi:hypothetical protein